MSAFWDFLVRLRTWLIGFVGIVLVLLPDLLPIVGELLNAPELIAVLPEDWRKYAAVAAIVFTVWSRWRPATRTADPEVQVKRAIKGTDHPATVIVEAGGETKAVIDA